MASKNGFAKYGKKLELLGKKFQNPNTKISDLFAECFSLGLMLSFRVEPDPQAAVEMTVDMPGAEKP